MAQKHSTLRGGQRLVWHTERLWDLARDLTPFEKPVTEFPELDRWFGSAHVPTVRAVIEHCRRIEAADLSIPVILNEDGSLMDGGHRIAKAILRGQTTVLAVQFKTMPEPDEIKPA